MAGIVAGRSITHRVRKLWAERSVRDGSQAEGGFKLGHT